LGLTALAGAALLEAALIPGLVIGGAAVLAPTVLPTLRRRIKPLMDSMTPGPAMAASSLNGARGNATIAAPNLGIKKAVAKTVTFRIIVTALDFTSNYVVLGEATTAAGLSTFALVVGPLFYLTHEAAWNYFAPLANPDEVPPPITIGGFTMSRALAKTITFRTVATAMDFTTLFVVVGDLPTAIGLSAFGFVVGPFVYWGHEKAWDYYGPSVERSLGQLLPPPESAPVQA
jgi:uncharacterized membrane protein